MFAVRPVVMPSALRDISNGLLPNSLLRPVPGGLLFDLAARAWVAMVAAAASDGIRLQPTSPGDLYRSYQAQEALFRRRYVQGIIPGRPQKRWNGQVWSLRTGMAPAAVPGTSNHGWGLAIDVATGAGRPVAIDPSHGQSTEGRNAYRWLVSNYARFGWSHEYRDPADEPWHIRYVAGDSIPDAVTAFDQPTVTPPPTVPPVVTPPPPTVTPPVSPTEDVMLAIYRPTFPTPAGYTAAWFVAFASGNIRRATNPDVTLAARLGVPTIDLDSAEQYGELLRASGSTYPPLP